MTTITALPAPPTRQDPASFAARGDAFLAALPDFVDEANALASEANANAAAAASSATAAATSATSAASSASSASTQATSVAANAATVAINKDIAVAAAASAQTSGSAVALQATLAASSGSSIVGHVPAGTGAVATDVQSKLRETKSISDKGVVSDGSTDQTATIVAALGQYASDGFRGWVKIPYNTKFNVATVYAAVPTGVIVDDESSINWGQPPSYKNKFRIMYSGDTVSDDTQEIIASGHHPAIMLLNMGTAGSGAASSRYASLLHGVGKNSDGDPMLGWLYQFAKDPAANQWRTSMRMQTPYSVAIGNPQPWITAHVYSAGAYCVSDSGKIYKTTAGGTSGGVAPTGTGSGINDGGVLWNYIQAAFSLDSTRFDWFEDGKSGQYAPVSGAARHTQQAGSKSWYLEIDEATGTITARDVSRGLNVFEVSTANGFQVGTGQSVIRLSVTGTGPNAPATGAGKVDNGGATNMSTMVPPVGRVKMSMSLRFDNSNTTVVHGTGTNAFTLKGAVNVTPTVGQFINFEFDSTLSARWFETGRSF